MARTKKGFGISNQRRDIRRVIGYVRISKNRSNQTSVSTEVTVGTQNEGIEQRAKREDWELVEILGDIGISAFDTSKERPDFERAIQMIEQGKADAIIVFKLDRFCRSVVEFHKAWERIKAAGGSFISITEGFDSTNPWGEAMMGIIAVFAQMESEMKRERAIPAMEYQRENGKVGPGARPYGYDKVTAKEAKYRKLPGEGARLSINKKEAELIRTAAKWVLDGGSLTGFIEHYQPASSVAKKKMTYRGLKLTLTGATTAGLREWPNNPDGSGFAQGEWEPILDRATWDQLREILLDPSRRLAPTNKKSHLLSGMLRCPACDKTAFARNWVNPNTGENAKRYQCGGCYISVNMAAVDSIIERELFERVPQSKWEQWQIAGKGWDQTVIDDIESRMAFYDRQFNLGKIDENRWLANTAELDEARSAALNHEPLDIPAVENLEESWSSLSIADKQKVLRLAFENIQILKENGCRDPHKRIAFV